MEPSNNTSCVSIVIYVQKWHINIIQLFCNQHEEKNQIVQWHTVSCNEHAVICETSAHGLLKFTHARYWNTHSLR